MPSTSKPPKEFLPWFARLKSGHWVVARADYVAKKIENWRRNKRGIRRWWELTPAERRAAYNLVTGRHRPTWNFIERLMKWSGLTAYYWLGPKPTADEILATIGIEAESEPAPVIESEPVNEPAPVIEPEPEPAPVIESEPVIEPPAKRRRYNFFAGCV